ncbi:hypothetical protein HNQ93_004020 [Hymenobacter luteus]|uniref:Uncharacterized protein n=2 Tax=Hymenobacter TaxID=89966 RepID=A0A7W9T3X5_9BACT|nr:hypothetical protein [Hymenobacter latericoloratus]MBB6061142.1 hypothetical protein [Hymenobacter luteus]
MQKPEVPAGASGFCVGVIQKTEGRPAPLTWRTGPGKPPAANETDGGNQWKVRRVPSGFSGVATRRKPQLRIAPTRASQEHFPEIAAAAGSFPTPKGGLLYWLVPDAYLYW